MSKATEVFQQLDLLLQERDGSSYPLEEALALQMQLAERVQLKMTEAQNCIEAAAYLLGTYQFSNKETPYSSTGRVLLIEQENGERLAVKLLGKQHISDPDGIQDPLYKFEDPAVRFLTAVGENLMGKAANKRQNFPVYYGVAGVQISQGNTVELTPFDMNAILAGEQEPAIVMRQMIMSVADLLLDLRETGFQDGYPQEELTKWTSDAFEKVLNSAVPMPDHLAKKYGHPDAVKDLFLNQTLGWLAGRTNDPDVQKHPQLVDAVRRANVVREIFRTFLALPETEERLLERSSPTIMTRGDEDKGILSVPKLSQTFSVGDTKFANMMIGQNAQGVMDVGLLDPIWLIMRGNTQEYEQPTFAPWPFADLIQTAAFAASQPAAYGFPELQQVIYDKLRDYYGPTIWTEWHELYLKMATSYKMLIDVAVGVDPYIEKAEKKAPIPRSLQWIMDEHPRAAVSLAKRAMSVYKREMRL